MEKKNSIDLLNVDYDDVLQLYRGWRRSEGMLKDKDKELAAMYERVEQLQTQHSKFRGQMAALEGIDIDCNICKISPSLPLSFSIHQFISLLLSSLLLSFRKV